MMTLANHYVPSDTTAEIPLCETCSRPLPHISLMITKTGYCDEPVIKHYCPVPKYCGEIAMRQITDLTTGPTVRSEGGPE